jgi:ketosteroid isomerase-like protein
MKLSFTKINLNYRYLSISIIFERCAVRLFTRLKIFSNLIRIKVKHISILLLLTILCGCEPKTDPLDCGRPFCKNVNLDSLNGLFLAGWNNKDSAGIAKIIAPHAILMNDSLIHHGLETIAKNWISGGVKVLSNIKTNALIRESNATLAYDGGTYTLDLSPPGGHLLKERGNYSLVWCKQPDESWKLTLIHIEDITRLPDIK